MYFSMATKPSNPACNCNATIAQMGIIDAIAQCIVAALKGSPQSDDAVEQIDSRHGANDTAAVGVD